MTAQDIIEIFKDYKSNFDIQRVRFWGGEPIIREDLFEIVKEISPSSHTEVVTNGTLINESKAKKIVESGLHLIEFSLDLPEEHNDFLRGKGVYKKALRAIDLINEEKKKQNRQYPVVKLRPLLTKKNYRSLRELFFFTKQKDAGFRLIFLRDHYDYLQKTSYEGKKIGYYQPGKPGANGQNKDIADLMLSPLECKKLWTRFYDLERGKNNSKFIENLKTILNHFDYILGSILYFDCSRSRNTVIVDPWGDLVCCEFLSFKYGNFFNEGPMSWFSERHRKFRQRVKEGSFPICRQCNRYGLYRPLLSTYIYASRWYEYLFKNVKRPPGMKLLPFRIKSF